MPSSILSKKKLYFISILYVWAIFPANAIASKLCFTAAGAHFKIDPLLLRSIATVESNLNSNAIGINRDIDGNIISRDYGIMQINQMHIPSLISKGIIKNEQELLNDSCLNITVGASILDEHFKICGMNWQCLGSYNVGFSKEKDHERLMYAQKINVIYDQLNRLESSLNSLTPPKK